MNDSSEELVLFTYLRDLRMIYLDKSHCVLQYTNDHLILPINFPPEGVACLFFTTPTGEQKENVAWLASDQLELTLDR